MLVARRLGSIASDVVFLGGCAAGLLITDKAAPPLRATRDVDVIAEVSSLLDYYELSQRLKDRGFKEDTTPGAPVCRLVAENIVLDLMPTEPTILGFGDRWFRQAMQHAWPFRLPSGDLIQMVSGPYFLITKLDAFIGRGNKDYLLSHDIEDFVAVLDGRPEIVDEVLRADPVLLRELAKRCSGLLEDTRFIQAISAHLPPDATSQARGLIVMDRLRRISSYPDE